MITATITAIAFFASLCFFALRLVARPSGGAASARLAALLFSAAAGIFLATRHHQDIMSGVDTAAYALLADDIRAGKPLVAPDSLYSSVPGDAQEAFLYRPRSVPGQTSLRPTRNLAYQLCFDGGGWARRPFYMAGYPLAAGGSHLGRAFSPCVGALFCLALLLAAVRHGGWVGLAGGVALLSATAYPAWFFRGDYPEAVAAAAILTVMLSHLAKPIVRPAAWFLAGFAVALPLSFHATALLVAGPVALLLVFGARSSKAIAALLVGLLAGFAPFVWQTRSISAPYGDWTRLTSLLSIASAAVEHAAMLAAVAAVLLFMLAALVASRIGSARSRLARAAAGTPLFAAALLALAPTAALSLAPGAIGAEVRFAITLAAKSVGAPALLLAALALCGLCRGRNGAAKALFTLFGWGACLFLLVLGHETLATHGPAAGIWNYRRLAPSVLAFISLFAVALPPPPEKSRMAKLAFFAALAVAAAANPLRSHNAYVAISGEGSDRFVAQVMERLAAIDADLVIFDYFPHSAPFGVKRGDTLGVAPHAYAKWGNVARWIGSLAAEGRKICIVSSYPQIPQMEEEFSLVPEGSVGMRRRVVKSKTFLDATVAEGECVLSFFKVETGAANQEIVFSGSPFGLRGNWTRAGRGGWWSRQDSGFVAPLPQPGAPVEALFDVEWIPSASGPSNRILRVDFPGNTVLATIRVTPGRHSVKTWFATEKKLPPSGIYTITSPAPYDPAKDGLRGYPGDLGVVFRGIEVKRAGE